MKLRRCQVVTSYRQLGRQTQLTLQEVRTGLRVLVEARLIVLHGGRRGTVATLLKYARYNRHKRPSQEVTHRNSDPLQPHNEIIKKNYKPFLVSNTQKKQARSRRSYPKNGLLIFRLLKNRGIPKTSAARTEFLCQLETLHTMRARAYLIQAGQGRNPEGLAWKMLSQPAFEPADWAWREAAREERREEHVETPFKINVEQLIFKLTVKSDCGTCSFEARRQDALRRLQGKETIWKKKELGRLC